MRILLALVAVMGSCQEIKEPIKSDIENIIEEIIKDQTGIEVDINPVKEEKAQSKD